MTLTKWHLDGVYSLLQPCMLCNLSEGPCAFCSLSFPSLIKFVYFLNLRSFLQGGMWNYEEIGITKSIRKVSIWLCSSLNQNQLYIAFNYLNCHPHLEPMCQFIQRRNEIVWFSFTLLWICRVIKERYIFNHLSFPIKWQVYILPWVMIIFTQNVDFRVYLKLFLGILL